MKTELKTLILEDVADDAELHILALKRAGIACHSRCVKTEADFRKQLAEFLPDLIISDFSLPGFDGLAALKIAHSERPDTPFIFVSGAIGEEQAVNLLKNGASDYILKGNPARLAQAVLRAVKEAQHRKQNKVQEHKISRLNRVYAVLSGINSLIVRVRDRQELFDGACRIAVEQGNFGMAWIGRFDPDTLDITPVAWAGLHAALLTQDKSTADSSRPRGQGGIGRAIRELKPIFENDMTIVPERGGKRRKEAIRLGYRSLIVLPLIVDGRAAGSMTLFAKEIDFFTEDELKLLTELAGNISFALGHIGREEKIARLSRIQAVMSNISSMTVRVRDRQELFSGACRIAVEYGGFAIAWVAILNPETLDLTPVAWSGPDAKSLASTPGTRNNLVAQALREKRAVFRNDMPSDPTVGSARKKEAARLGYRSFIALPLLVEGTVVANISLYTKEPNFFTGEELTLLNQLASDISFALEHIEKEEKIARLSRIHAVMSNINSLIVRVRDRQELFNEACRIAVEHGGFGIAWIGVFDPDTRKITPIAWNGLDSESLIQAPSAPWSSALTEHSIVGRAIHEKRASIVNDITVNAAEGGVVRREAIRRGYRSLIALPLLVQGAAVGNLSIFAREVNFFSEDEVKLLTELARDISFALEYIAKEERINYLAYHDILTGLPNRNLLADRLTQAISHSKRSGCMTAIAFIDLDHFKLINDSLGHNAGDQLLQAISKRLVSCTRDGDTVARLGGDEFILVLRDQADVETTTHVMQRIIEEVKQPVGSGDNEMHTACSIGIALYPQDGADVETLLKNADAAMYRAKDTGRNNFQFYEIEMNAKVNERLLIESKLRHAIERNELFVNYQPQIDLRSGRMIGVEALVRWRNPDIGLVPPGRFIPLAEESDLILSIGEWVMRQACVQAKAWQDQGLRPISVSVNVSGRQFRQTDLPEIVARTLRESGLDPKYLCLELTESVVMHNVAGVIATMRKFETMGVELSIDDFGTGYSSLSYLKRFPVSKLKIDQSFVRDLASDPDDAAIAQSVISLGHSLGLKVVAEGVETQEQLAFLRARGCDEVQGYYFSRPVDPENLRVLLLNPRCLPAEESE